MERQPGESSNDRNDRAIREATLWYESHLKKVQDSSETKIQVVLLTNDRDNMEKARQLGLKAFTGENCIEEVLGMVT